MKSIIIFAITTLFLFSAPISYDKDMDGVIDTIDKCPGTSFFDIVNSSGCTIKHIAMPKNKENEDTQPKG